MHRFKPLLSAKIFSTEPGQTEANYKLIRWPAAASIKYDGIRLLEYGGQMVTRSLKPLRNAHAHAELREMIAAMRADGMCGADGEIIVGPANHPNAMQNTTSGVMSGAGQPDFTYYMFDSYQHASRPFEERSQRVGEWCYRQSNQFPWLRYVPYTVCRSLDDFLQYEAERVAEGYEGAMLRSLSGHYKMGRSTMRENILMALKRFEDDEALILEYHEELENANVATENALGHTERSGHKENLIPKGRMGTMLAVSLKFEKTFWLGGGRGITHDLRQQIWDNPRQFQWRLANYVYQHVGIKDRPRLPRFKSWRSWQDMDPERARALLELGAGHVFGGTGLPAVLPEFRPQL